MNYHSEYTDGHQKYTDRSGLAICCTRVWAAAQINSKLYVQLKRMEINGKKL